MLRVAVDFGTSSTCVVVSAKRREPQVVVIDGHPLLPSAVFAAADGTLFVGQEAERQAAIDPARYEPHPKRRINEGELLLGDTVLTVREVVHAVLRRAVSEARRFADGSAVELLVLTHPADWGVVRTRVLRQAAIGLARDVVLVPEPVGAAVFHASTFVPSMTGKERTVEFSGVPGETLAVLDVGGGTVDVSVVQRDKNAGRGGYRVLATKGDPNFGGADIDQMLLEHVGTLVSDTDLEAWQRLMQGRELTDRRRRRVLRQDVRGAKETLSRHTYTDIPMPSPFSDAHVTREALERLIAGRIGGAVELTAAAIAETGLRPKQLTGVFLVGGSSRIPMLSRQVHQRLGIVPTTLDQPETVVARGAMRTALAERPASRAAPALPRPPRPQAPAPAHRPPARITSHVPSPAPATARRKSRPLMPWLVGGAGVVALAAVAVLLVVLFRSDGEEKLEVADFDYRFSAPADWVQTDRIVGSRQIAVRPEEAQQGGNMVSVQSFDLPFDAEQERDRFVDNLERELDAAGVSYSDLDPDAEFAGRDVIYYTQPGTDRAVDWFVIVDGDIQVSIGCHYTEGGIELVKPGCEEVVRSLRIEASDPQG